MCIRDRISIEGAPATRVRKTVAECGPCGLTFLRSSSGSIAEPRFFTVRMPTPRSRSSALSLLRPKGSTSVISYAVAYGVARSSSAVTYAMVGSMSRPASCSATSATRWARITAPSGS